MFPKEFDDTSTYDLRQFVAVDGILFHLPSETPTKQRAAFPLIRAAKNVPRLTDEQIYASLNTDEGLV